MRPDRMMWGAGLALAGAVFTGLVLNLVTGLTPLSWAIALAVAVAAVVCADLVIIRRRSAEEVASAPVTDVSAEGVKPAPVRRSGFRFSPVTGGFLMLAAVLAGGAIWLANASTGWQHSPGFAQLWLTPSSGTTSTLGVRDNFPGQQTFRLVVRGNGGKVLGAWDLSLAQGQAWQRTVARPAGSTLTARLGMPGQTLTVTS
jgi:hypothetical protein